MYFQLYVYMEKCIFNCTLYGEIFISCPNKHMVIFSMKLARSVILASKVIIYIYTRNTCLQQPSPYSQTLLRFNMKYYQLLFCD